MSEIRTIAVIGGTGSLGKALAWRWARAGYDVTIGSRSEDGAQTAAADINARLGSDLVKAAANPDAADGADVVVLTVPFSAHEPTLESIKPRLSGQILIDTTVPLCPPKVSVVQLPKGGCAAEITQRLVGESAQVASAYHNVSAVLLNKDVEIDCDILVFADDLSVRKKLKKLVEDSGCRPINAGKLANSAASEALTSVLIHINRTYKTPHSGIRITGIETDSE